jgi:hypothetical protein
VLAKCGQGQLHVVGAVLGQQDSFDFAAHAASFRLGNEK